MNRKILFKPIVFLAIFLIFLNSLAEKFYWYYTIWWFDMVVHFLGGFWQGIFFLWYFSVVRLPFLRRPIREFNMETARHALWFVLLVGVSWEAGEYLTFNLIGRDPFSMIDSISDVLIDLAGGAVALIYSFKKIMPKQEVKIQ